MFKCGPAGLFQFMFLACSYIYISSAYKQHLQDAYKMCVLLI